MNNTDDIMIKNFTIKRKLLWLFLGGWVLFSLFLIHYYSLPGQAESLGYRIGWISVFCSSFFWVYFTYRVLTQMKTLAQETGQECQQLEISNANLLRKNNSMERQHRKFKELEASRAHLFEQNKSLEFQVQSIEKRLQKSELQYKKLESTHAELFQQNSNLETQIKDIEEKNQKARLQNKEIEGINANLSKQNKSLEAETAALSERKEAVEIRVKSLEVIEATSVQQSQELEAKIAALAEQNNDLEIQIKTAGERHQESEERRKDMEVRLAVLAEQNYQLKDIKEQNQKLHLQCQNLEAEKVDFFKQKRSLKVEIEHLEAQFKTLQEAYKSHLAESRVESATHLHWDLNYFNEKEVILNFVNKGADINLVSVATEPNLQTEIVSDRTLPRGERGKIKIWSKEMLPETIRMEINYALNIFDIVYDIKPFGIPKLHRVE